MKLSSFYEDEDSYTLSPLKSRKPTSCTKIWLASIDICKYTYIKVLWITEHFMQYSHFFHLKSVPFRIIVRVQPTNLLTSSGNKLFRLWVRAFNTNHLRSVSIPLRVWMQLVTCARKTGVHWISLWKKEPSHTCTYKLTTIGSYGIFLYQKEWFSIKAITPTK